MEFKRYSFNTVGELKSFLNPFVDETPIGIREENSKVVRTLDLSSSLEALFDRWYVVFTVEDGAKEIGKV